MRFTALTCTGDRPEAFALCEKYMVRQSLPLVQWIVMDDGTVPTVCTMGQEYHYFPQMQGRGSLVKKIRYVLERLDVTGDALAFIEDDDYYTHDWLAFCADGLKTTQLFGEGRALYYNVRGRWWFEHDNMNHASLCSTVCRKQVLPLLLAAAQKSEVPFIDVALWSHRELARGIFDPLKIHPQRRHVIGMKAMPGRPGYGTGHRDQDPSAATDPDGEILRSWIGNDAEAYATIFKPAPTVYPAKPAVLHSVTGTVRGPNWSKWLSHLCGRPKVYGLEIGTFKGESAEYMLDNIFTEPTSRYFCVDPFTGSIDHKIHGIDVSDLELQSRKRLKRFGNVEFRKGYSNEVLRRLEPGFDFIYIDGAHDAMNVLRDSVLAFELLKPEGILVWDDHDWAEMPNEIERPKMAIAAFFSCYASQLDIIQRTGWQVCARKKT